MQPETYELDRGRTKQLYSFLLVIVVFSPTRCISFVSTWVSLPSALPIDKWRNYRGGIFGKDISGLFPLARSSQSLMLLNSTQEMFNCCEPNVEP